MRRKGFKVKPNLSKSNIAYFDSGVGKALDFTNFSESEPVVKKALVLVEGTHVDSNKRTHTFTKDRIKKIVDNSNRFLSRTRIPLLKDHKKVQDSTIGDIEGNFVAKIITDADIFDSKHQDLVGKLGVFATEVVVKSRKAIEDCAQGLLNTISPGIDIATDTIKEISATPIPAIAGMSLFARDVTARFNALTLSEALNQGEDVNAMKEEAHNLLDTLLGVLDNIAEADEDELEGADQVELQTSAIGEFAEALLELIGASPEAAPLSEEEEMQLQQLQMRQQLATGGVPGGQQPGFLQRQQGIQSNGQIQMNRNQGMQPLFTLSDIETAKYGAPLGEDATFARGADKQPRKKRGLGRTVAMGAAGAAGLGVAALGGRAAIRGVKAGSRVGRSVYRQGGSRLASARIGGAIGLTAAGRSVKRDGKRLGKTAKRLGGRAMSGLGSARQSVARTAYRAMGRKPNKVG